MSSTSWKGDMPQNPTGAQVIQPPNPLRSRLGSRLPKIDPDAIAKAEAALQGLSSQFGAWLRDEVAKLEAAQVSLRADGMTQQGIDRLYTHAHDLKGLGATYGFPLVTRIAGSLCTLLGEQATRSQTPPVLIYAHVDAIRVVVREDMRDADDASGRVLAEQLEHSVAAYMSASGHPKS